MEPRRPVRLEAIEAYYDTVPRAAATTEEVGPFTLFLAAEGTGWQFYARPRIGVETSFTAGDVRRVLARQEELGLPRAIEWVDEVTPSLLPAVIGAGFEPGRYPLLALPEPDGFETGAERPPQPPGATSTTTRVLGPDDPDLALSIGAVGAAFDGADDFEPGNVGRRPELIAAGHLIVVAAYDDRGRVVGGGSASPRGDTAELMGIGVPKGHRNLGVGTAVTDALVDACRAAGVRTPFLSAYNDAAASIYRRVGFVDIGTACILEA